jgi:hypothetical protein
MSQPIRFLDLPRELRCMVYELVSETVLRAVFPKEGGVYYDNARAPTALLVANNLIHREVKAWIDIDTRLKMSATVVICRKGQCTNIGTQFTSGLIHRVWMSDAMHKSRNTS